MQWLFLDLHAFFASCEQQENSALRGQPVIVVQTLTASAVAIAARLLGSAQRSVLLSLEEFGHSPSAVRTSAPEISLGRLQCTICHGPELEVSRFRAQPHLSTRQYARIVHAWVESAGLESSAYGTHSMRRTKAAQIELRGRGMKSGSRRQG